MGCARREDAPQPRHGGHKLCPARPEPTGQIPARALLRLAKPARLHNTAIVFLTRKEAGDASLGSMIALHAVVSRERQGERFVCRLTVQKDKQQGRGGELTEVYDGPPGLC